MAEPSKRNIEQVTDAFARWNAGERDIGYDTIDPEVELYTPLGSTRGAPIAATRDAFYDQAQVDEPPGSTTRDWAARLAFRA